jgi:hypothetical protein
MYLVINTKTIGYPRLDLPLADIRQPIIRHLSAIVFDSNGKEIDMVSAPNPYVDLSGSGSSFPQNDVSLAQAKGGYVHPQTLFSWFTGWADRCDMIVGHNVNFDLHAMRVLVAQLIGTEWSPTAALYCTMINAAPILKLPNHPDPFGESSWKFRAPTISECMRYFWDEDFPDDESTLDDARACNRIFRQLSPNL